MASAFFNINSKKTVVFADKLEQLSRTALPNVVRKTLNAAAMDVKKRTLPASAASTFTTRKKNFFRALSRVEFASGHSVNNMASKVGMMDTSKAVDNLDEQERGGTIGGRKYIPVDKARISSSRNKLVRKKNKGVGTKTIVKPKAGKGYWKSAAMKAGVGALIQGSFSPIVFRIKRIKKSKISLEPVYMKRKTSTFTVKGTGFSSRAAYMSQSRMPQLFNWEAEKRFKRILR